MKEKRICVGKENSTLMCKRALYKIVNGNGRVVDACWYEWEMKIKACCIPELVQEVGCVKMGEEWCECERY